MWSDGEPLSAYQSWVGGQPDDGSNPVWGVECGDTAQTGQDCVVLDPRTGWKDSPCSGSTAGNFTSRSDNKDDNGAASGLTVQDGCAEFRLPYICSKPPIPGRVYSAACLIRINHSCSRSFPNSSSLTPLLCGCSTIATATGGFMHGCKGGHWVMGTSHSSTFLPPTLVRAPSMWAPALPSNVCLLD